jgi:hypothetical protein
MKKESDQLEALQDIRKMMKESSRFLSLSGLSGIFAGLFALIGAYVCYGLIGNYNTLQNPADSFWTLIVTISCVALAVLVLSISAALYFSNKKAKKNNHKLFDHSSRLLLWSMGVPLFAGGVFCIALISAGFAFIQFVAPAMLVFYGVALINSSRLTLTDLRMLGFMELFLGLIAAFIPSLGLLFWALGFGVLHIIYGSIVWFKYDLKP